MSTHPSRETIELYADRDAILDESTLWSVENHLQECASCRATVPGTTDDLLARVMTGIELGIAATPVPAPGRRWWAPRHRWVVWRLVPWLIMTVAVLACAATMEHLRPLLPSLVMLLAPVAPLPAVAVAWGRRHDPAWELTAATPAAGLGMLLRRTAGLLVVIVPALAVASSRAGVSTALVLLPCLAFTTATIGLGAFLGVHRAAVVLGAAWIGAAVIPALYTAHLPVVLAPGSTPVWCLLVLALAGFTATRAHRFRRMASHR